MKEKSGSEDVTWDLTHLYQDTNDKNIIKDIETIKNKIVVFSVKYRGKLRNISIAEFLGAITEYEELSRKTTRLGSFAYLNFVTQSNNAKAGAFLQRFQEISSHQLHILTQIFNTILADKMITDRLRKYPDWISSMHLDNEIDEKVVKALVDAVKSRYDIPQRYYRLKKDLLGLDELFDYDRYAPLPVSSEKMIPDSGTKGWKS